MTDRCLSFTATAPGRFLTRRLGLPQPAKLARRSQAPSLNGELLNLTAGKSELDHNAGITRGRRLVNMPAERWSSGVSTTGMERQSL